jgi:P27 family predicted phage terminase small subunit
VGRLPLDPDANALRGNLGRRSRRRILAPEIAPDPPMPPAHLCPAARIVWIRLAPSLVMYGLLSELDHDLFAGYCEATVAWEAAKALVVTAEKDADKHRHARVARQNLRSMAELSDRLGLSPTARLRLGISRVLTDPNAPKGKFHGLLAGPNERHSGANRH